jgi:beta-N-acetylhexosaminidase
LSEAKAVVVGLAGTALSRDEAALLARHRPLGVILFKRNVEARDQLRRLTTDVRVALGDGKAPILVDQEGGRVARLGPPEWRRYPPARRLGELAERDRARARAAARSLARRIAFDLAEVGIDWNCAPVLDIARPETHVAIGDRALAADPVLVGDLGAAAVAGFLEGGVVPIVKHAPGHGRARSDPHLDLPRIDATAQELEALDEVPFRRLAKAPAVMIAHVVYTALDPAAPASCSTPVVDHVRHGLGMTGLVVSDDVDMGALAGTTDVRVRAVLEAGCDVALQCNGRSHDLEAALDASPPLSAAARKRLDAARSQRLRSPTSVDVAALDEALAAALA